jgi:hypothetical protein
VWTYDSGAVFDPNTDIKLDPSLANNSWGTQPPQGNYFTSGVTRLGNGQYLMLVDRFADCSGVRSELPYRLSDDGINWNQYGTMKLDIGRALSAYPGARISNSGVWYGNLEGVTALWGFLGYNNYGNCGYFCRSRILPVKFKFNPSPLTINAPAGLAPNTSGYVASLQSPQGTGITWTATGATITAGQGTSQVTFSSQSAGTTAKLSVSSSLGTGERRAQTSFLDVPAGDPFNPFVNNIAGNTITSGCGGGSFCPSGTLTREQMAVFLLRSKYGPNFTPPNATGIFTDVPPSSGFARWIERNYLEEVMDSCGSGTFCPAGLVTRAKMAVFLIKSKYGSCFEPLAATGVFADVPPSDPDAKYIEKLYHDGVTSGCLSSPLSYCPTSNLTRGQMAVFLVANYGIAFP